jgi:predicted house-cleaning noncanonical NTP pyrophosphatase (MazG superfamily)
LDKEDFKMELLKKLVEEAQEVVGAKDDNKELVKELGDILEVIDCLVKSFDLDKSEIERVKSERKDSRGGFDKKLLLEYTDK